MYNEPKIASIKSDKTLSEILLNFFFLMKRSSCIYLAILDKVVDDVK